MDFLRKKCNKAVYTVLILLPHLQGKYKSLYIKKIFRKLRFCFRIKNAVRKTGVKFYKIESVTTELLQGNRNI